MENVEDLNNVCEPLAPSGLVDGGTCALVYKGGDRQGVIHAMTLISTLLNCVDQLQDKYVLLICKRSAWKEAADSLGRGMTDCFEDCSFPCNELYNQASTPEECNNSVYRLLRHAFRTDERATADSRSQKSRGALSQATEYNLCSQMSSASLHTFGTMPSLATGFSQYERYAHLMPSQGRIIDNYINMQKLIVMEKSRELKLQRLVVRFVDEVPLEKMEHGRNKKTSTAFNSFVEPGMETKWNYLQAANEIAFHPEDIGTVVIVGLASVKLHAHHIDDSMAPPGTTEVMPPCNPAAYESCTGKPSAHPFDSYKRPKWELEDEDEDSNVAYQHRHISLYAFALQLTINALQANLDRSAPLKEGLPKLFLLEGLPTASIDQKKFIAFLRSRFQFIYRLE